MYQPATTLHGQSTTVPRGERLGSGDEWRWLWRQLRPFMRYEIGSVFLILLASALSLTSPLLMKWLIDHILSRHAWRELIAATALSLAVNIGGQALKSTASLIAAGGVLKCGYQIRRRLLATLTTLPPVFYA